MSIKFVFNDGGRQEAGFKEYTGDCCCRAISIALNLPYKEVYKTINEISKAERYRGKSRSGNGVSNARTGVYIETMREIMNHYGWVWVPTMKFGEGCKVHLNDGELPTDGPIICNLSKHYAAVVDGVLYDAYDCSRDGTRCVYGYWKPATFRVYGDDGWRLFSGTKQKCLEYVHNSPEISLHLEQV